MEKKEKGKGASQATEKWTDCLYIGSCIVYLTYPRVQ